MFKYNELKVYGLPLDKTRLGKMPTQDPTIYEVMLNSIKDHDTSEHWLNIATLSLLLWGVIKDVVYWLIIRPLRYVYNRFSSDYDCNPIIEYNYTSLNVNLTIPISNTRGTNFKLANKPTVIVWLESKNGKDNEVNLFQYRSPDKIYASETGAESLHGFRYTYEHTLFSYFEAHFEELRMRVEFQILNDKKKKVFDFKISELIDDSQRILFKTKLRTELKKLVEYQLPDEQKQAIIKSQVRDVEEED